MKLHINMPDVEKGAELEVMYVGLVKQGDTVELTESQVQAFKDAGHDMSGDSIKLYNEAPVPAKGNLQTTNLPGIEEVAEKERAKNSRKTSKEGDK